MDRPHAQGRHPDNLENITLQVDYCTRGLGVEQWEFLVLPVGCTYIHLYTHSHVVGAWRKAVFKRHLDRHINWQGFEGYKLCASRCAV